MNKKSIKLEKLSVKSFKPAKGSHTLNGGNGSVFQTWSNCDPSGYTLCYHCGPSDAC